MTSDYQPDVPQPKLQISATERRVLAVVVILGLHLAILGFGLLAEVGAAGTGPRVVPREPLLTVIVSLLQAWCSLGAIWWARSRWPSHVKTLLTAGVCAATWAALIGILDATDFTSDRAAGWGASLVTQAVAIGLGTALIALLRGRDADAQDHRFTILFLLIWTAVVAVLLGAARVLAESFGWTLAVFRWEYFVQLQVIALFNALLAISLWAAIHARRTWRSRLLMSLSITLSMMLVVNVLMRMAFGSNVGADVVDICWLYGGQALFLVATLAPLARGTDGLETRPTLNLTAAEQIPPPPDSGR